MILERDNNLKLDRYNKNKRIFDFIVSILIIIIASPLFLFIILFMKVNEPKGEIVFKQKRIGQNGIVFNIYKFRSMKKNADEILRADDSLYKAYIKNGYKLEQDKDPRITRLGRFLRKTSLDELPQLINVIKGDMSLVGPRPIVVEELTEYEKTDSLKQFLSMKPGITGVWQVSGRSNIGYPERVYLEISYANNLSLKTDIKILFLTIFKVLIKEGAY